MPEECLHFSPRDGHSEAEEVVSNRRGDPSAAPGVAVQQLVDALAELVV